MNQTRFPACVCHRSTVLLGIACTARSPARRPHQGAQRRGRGHRQVARAAGRRGPRRLDHARVLLVHHRARSVPRRPARPPALPAQVLAGGGPGLARERRPRRHRHQPRDRRRHDRQLRRMPRAAARRGGRRRRRRHAARQPRCAAPLRPRPEGDARRRDHARPARPAHAGAGGRTQATARPSKPHWPARASTTASSSRIPTAPSTPRASSASIRTCACGRSSRTAARSRSASSSSAR